MNMEIYLYFPLVIEYLKLGGTKFKVKSLNILRFTFYRPLRRIIGFQQYQRLKDLPIFRSADADKW